MQNKTLSILTTVGELFGQKGIYMCNIMLKTTMFSNAYTVYHQ